MQIADRLVSAASYWLPRNWVLSAWVGHAPFAAFLVDAARPRIIVELGTHNGFSFFSMADAVRKLRIDTEMYAVDSWEGDDHAGAYGEEVYEGVVRIASGYERIHLVRGYFDQMVGRFEDSSIDILHIDGRHGYEDVRSDFEAYRPKLSDRAVVIFHDTQEHEHGFGVYRFWAEISEGRPSFEFFHSHGLGVLAWGAEAPARVLDFIEASRAEPDVARSIYGALGAEAERYDAHLRALSDEAAILRADNAELHRLGEGAEIAVRSAVEETAQVRAVLEAEVAAARDEAARSDALRTDEAQAAQAEIEGLRVQLVQLNDALAGMEAAVDQVRAERDALMTSRSWRLTAPLRKAMTALRGEPRGK